MENFSSKPFNEHSIKPLVETEWLEKHLNDPDLRIIDATVQVSLWPFPRIKSGWRGFKRCHIPGAIFIDHRKLADPAKPSYTFTLPPKEHFAKMIGSAGIGNHHRVVIYDSRENMWAARLWWMFRKFGFDQVAVLNGGLKAWLQEKRATSKKVSKYSETTFTPQERRGLIVNKEVVLLALEDNNTCIVSALGRRQHRGEKNEYKRRGHIPGAKNVTAWEILDRETGRYRSREELRVKFEEVLKLPKIITYCGGGIAASSDAFVLNLLGHKNVAVYDGGLIEWGSDPKLPLEIDTAV
ncbi:sulfurtransferase [Kangiella sediminilitoris]|uniref:Thiosulfate sulfurtransferase n=1 Tax=Kangiella sediminilitoris TaxID=1144748 RepID=A0A1B3B7M4_9GAMM|nr:sulfurtransferase [Kangiella sediminilitoris]AOE48790.1 Thiosulfate sulfurtransferase [Kangiella sediminilitoris]